jgi:putative ABC transport system substrate-binding protein
MIRSCVSWLTLLVLAMMVLCPPDVQAEIKIGVLIFSDEARYQESFKGIKEQLARSGYKEPRVKFLMGNAAGSKAKAANLVRSFAADNLSLLITIGTNATVVAAREIKDIPIVFSQFYDPIGAGVAKSWNNSGTNATGVSTMFDLSELVIRLQEVYPAKRLAVLYTPGESNTESQLRDLQKLQKKHGIEVLPVILAKKEDIVQILPDVMSTVDAVYLSGSSVIGANLSQIVGLANNSKVITITMLEDLAEKGVMLAVCGDPYAFGVIAGKKAAAVLKGAKPSSIPIEHSIKPGLIINKKTAKAAQVEIPKALLQKAIRVLE